jgi:HlyD family secretion protein
MTPTIPGVDASAPRFPNSIVAGAKHRRRQRLRSGIMILVALGVVAAGAFVATNVTRSEAPQYRTAVAAAQQVDAVLTSVATIEPVTQASVAFPVAGTVATVDIASGDTVTAGQRLATLDTTELEASLRSAQATLAQAQLVLQTALDGDDPSSLQTGQGIADTVSGGADAMLLPAATGDAVWSFASAVTVSDDDLTSAQQAVLSAQTAVSNAIADASATLGSATSVCAAVGDSVTVTTDPDDPTAPPSVDTSPIEACQAALNDVLSAQQGVSDAQDALATAASSLNDLLAQRAADLAPPPPTPATTVPDTESTTTTSAPSASSTAPTTSTPAGSTPGGSSPDGSSPDSSVPTGGSGGGGFSGGGASGGGAGGSTSSTPSAEDLIAYQSAVDAAQLAVSAANQAIAQATIVSPIDGQVISIGFAVGDSAEAASATQAVVVEGSGGFEASTTVSITHIPEVKVGQAATLLADGSSQPIDGQVTSISTVPDASASTTSYRVTISLTGDTSTLGNGAVGTVTITTGTTTAAVAVPTSAVTAEDGRYTVTTFDGTTATAVQVEVGVIGAAWTEITRGIDAGQTVVVADLSKPLPSAATDTSNASSGTTGGPFGGAFPGGGFGARRG